MTVFRMSELVAFASDPTVDVDPRKRRAVLVVEEVRKAGGCACDPIVQALRDTPCFNLVHDAACPMYAAPPTIVAIPKGVH